MEEKLDRILVNSINPGLTASSEATVTMETSFPQATTVDELKQLNERASPTFLFVKYLIIYFCISTCISSSVTIYFFTCD